MITVFYDGLCGLCSREIAFYRRLSPRAPIAWCDIARDPAPLEQRGISQADGLYFLHAEDSAGHMHVGLDAFVLIWRHFTGWRLLADFVRLPGIRPAADRLYRWFAAYRFKRLGHCQAALDRAAPAKQNQPVYS